MTYDREIKTVKLLQDRGAAIGSAHREIAADLKDLKRRLVDVDGAKEVLAGEAYEKEKARILAAAEDAAAQVPLVTPSLDEIQAEAEARHPETLGLSDILTPEDFARIDAWIAEQVRDFDRRYGLDAWDYAIAGGCGLFAAMLDLLCVRAPLRPTVAWTRKMDGIFNRGVQNTFNTLLPPELSHALSRGLPIGAPDTSVATDLIGAPAKALNPKNHRLRSLAHDPILGFLFGVLDMRRGTCTTVVDGRILSIPSTRGPIGGNVFQLLGRMMGHLLSDVNAPSANGNRGMGLPAPFMGLLRMLDGIPVGESTFGKQVEWMFVHGYDFRQFVTTAIPTTIMEVLLRVFSAGKENRLYAIPFGESLMATMPGRMTPRFRMILALAYGTCSAVNAGKVAVTGNILDAGYAAWLGLVWNGFFALKWALLDRHLKLWDGIEAEEIAALEDLVARLPDLEARAQRLPV